jgi:hypothetical protein
MGAPLQATSRGRHNGVRTQKATSLPGSSALKSSLIRQQRTPEDVPLEGDLVDATREMLAYLAVSSHSCQSRRFDFLLRVEQLGDVLLC